MFLFTLVIILMIFTLDITLSTLNYRHRHQPIPQHVQDVYDEPAYKKWLNYTMEVFKLSILVKVLSTTVLIVFLLLDVFPLLAKTSEQITSNGTTQIIVFLGLYVLINYLLGIGFQVYRTFSIEARYGFNQSTVKIFITDQIKSILLTIILGGGLLYLLLYLYQQFGNWALIYAWGILIAIMVMISIMYTRVFIRLFNKLTPLPEGDLRDKAILLGNNMGYEIKKISIIDASKRSARLNAFFTGFGKFKHIILYDTLLEKCTTDEIISVLAHEIGHAKHKDVLRNFLISMVQIGIYFSLLSFFLTSDAFANAFGFETIHIGFAIILFGILMEPLGIVMSIPLTALSRKAEYKADAYAAKAGFTKAMISALKVLARENFSNLTPHPLVVKLSYSHPPVNQRIKALLQLDIETES